MSNRDHFLGHKSAQEVRFNEKSILDQQKPFRKRASTRVNYHA